MTNNWFDDEQDNIESLESWTDISDDFHNEKPTVKLKDIINRIKQQDDFEEERNWKRTVLSGMFEHDCFYIKDKLDEFFPDVECYDTSELYKYIYINNNYEDGGIEDFCFQAANILCKRLGVSKGLFFPLALEIIIHIIKDRLDDALNLYVILSYPNFAAGIFGNFESDLGRKGGRPQHIHKDEALNLINEILDKNPFENIDILTANVFQRLSDKYTDAPSLSTINRWVKRLNRPKPLLN
ncbi:TPA: hypothetical protein ACPEUI_001236 [Morganella morganii]